jgi:hypothetical protein
MERKRHPGTTTPLARSFPHSATLHVGYGLRDLTAVGGTPNRGRRMRKLIILLCAIALFGMSPSAAQAENGACKFAEWSYSYFRIEQQGETWTYLLTAAGLNWRNVPFGYHAPGYLESARGWGGLYHFSDQADVRPATPAEHAERARELTSSSIVLGSAQRPGLKQLGSREGISLGPLTGYAVLFRFVAKEGNKNDLAAAQQDGFLEINLSDGCVSFVTSIRPDSSGGDDPWAALDSLLTEVTIERIHGARAGPRPPPGSGTDWIARPGGGYDWLVKPKGE